MEDKFLMEGLLWDTKVLIDLCMHGSIESSTKDVHETFLVALKDVLQMQHEIYQAMSEMGFYTTTEVEQSKIDKVMQKFKSFAEQEG
jgi:spore coat protein CotF